MTPITFLRFCFISTAFGLTYTGILLAIHAEYLSAALDACMAIIAFFMGALVE